MHTTMLEPSQIYNHTNTNNKKQRNKKTQRLRQETRPTKKLPIRGNPYIKPSGQEKPTPEQHDKWRQTELPKPLDDNLHYGDTSLIKKSPKSARLYFLNVNTIKAKNNFDHMLDICCQSEAAGIDFLLLAEVNINLREPKLRSTIKKHIGRIWDNKTAWATATCRSKSHTKPGAVSPSSRGIGRHKSQE